MNRTEVLEWLGILSFFLGLILVVIGAGYGLYLFYGWLPPDGKTAFKTFFVGLVFVSAGGLLIDLGDGGEKGDE